MDRKQSDDSSSLHTAQEHFQQKHYDLCLLTLHAMTQHNGPAHPDAQALMAICKIHKFAALQEWHKVSFTAYLQDQYAV